MCTPKCEITPSGGLERWEERAASKATGAWAAGPVWDAASLHIWPQTAPPPRGQRVRVGSCISAVTLSVYWLGCPGYDWLATGPQKTPSVWFLLAFLFPPLLWSPRKQGGGEWGVRTQSPGRGWEKHTFQGRFRRHGSIELDRLGGSTVDGPLPLVGREGQWSLQVSQGELWPPGPCPLALPTAATVAAATTGITEKC